MSLKPILGKKEKERERERERERKAWLSLRLRLKTNLLLGQVSYLGLSLTALWFSGTLPKIPP